MGMGIAYDGDVMGIVYDGDVMGIVYGGWELERC
jgi:hypothetical protein